jgi:catechol 2,3-dioxygenase-like lactoylglutathione lyase family enzyme
VPKVAGILETALYVDDIGRSLKFYQTIFGFPVIDTAHCMTVLGTPDRKILLLCDKKATANLKTGAHYGDGHLHLCFAVPSAEMEAWEQWLPEQGVPIEERRTWDHGGRSIYFRDPDHHLIELATPGTWPIY